MTNSEIIFQERTKLLKAGLIKGTGRFITMVVINAEGDEEEKQFEIPEELHTYASWKKLGYKVKNGEHAIAKFPIWKYTTKKVLDDNKQVVLDEAGNEMETSNMFMKVSAFFSESQVERLGVK